MLNPFKQSRVFIQENEPVDCETSCGTLVVNGRGQIILGHVTGTDHWDIPKGRQESGEAPLDAAKRELAEETGLVLNEDAFEEIGQFDYRQDKKLHLYKVHVADSLKNLECLQCTTYFPCNGDNEPVLAFDGFCWASRDDLPKLCLPRLANRLLALEW